MIRRRRFRAMAAALVGAWLCAEAPRALAQMMLPGAVNGNAGRASPKAAPGGAASSEAPHAPPRPVVVKAPSEETIVGHALSHDGTTGAMTFVKTGADLVLSKLAMTGARISAPRKDCSVEVDLRSPMIATPSGRPQGAIRFAVPLTACPYTIDVLDGAVLVATPAPTCDFAAANCRVSLAGLWGPTAAEITPKQAKDLERERVRIETTMRADFRVLLKRAGKDRAAVKAIARDQAGFSSEREMTCRDYAQESVHGFCSTQITEARVLALLAEFGDEPERPPERKRAARAKLAPPSHASVPTAPPPTASAAPR